MKQQIKILHIACYIAICMYSSTTYGQAIDNTLSFKNINSHRYFRFNYENDYFSAADKYYTQGMRAELVAPWIRHFPLSKLLFRPKYSDVRYGLSVENDIYTPTRTDTGNILYNDRPYASSLFLSTFLIAADTVKHQRFSAIFTVGLIGPAAGAMDLQTGAHRLFPHNKIPEGWINQIQNDVLVNYQVNYERQLCSLMNIFSLDVNGMMRIGTLSDKASVGFTVMCGYFDSPYSSRIASRSNFRLYAYDHPEINVIGYDATLQGGMFNKTSSYTISSGGIRRFTFQNRFGLVCVINRISLEYFRAFISSEFTTGSTHSWGGIQIAAAF